MRILVCGGREFTDSKRIDEALDDIHSARPITELIHGDCRGADRLAADWARRRKILIDPHPAAWDNLDVLGAVIRLNPKTGKFYNKAAGHQRNRKMLERTPELVVAFPGGEGTANMIAQALKVGIAVMSVDG